MKIRFFEPPPAQKAGGLHAAIDSLRTALNDLGHQVRINVDRNMRRPCHAAHFHGLWQPGFSAIARACRKGGIPYVVSPHGMLEPWARRNKAWKKWPYFHLIEKRWIGKAACILATAEGEANRLRAIFPRSRIEWLPLGLTAPARPAYEPARRALGWNEAETVILFLSRIHEKKGLDLLLTALASLHGQVPAPARLVVVGPREQRDHVAWCTEFATRNAARLPEVNWIGPVWGDDRWPYFQGADLFCLPTHSENFGLAVLESCQVGTPALTTTETPWVEALGGGRGFIARPEAAEIAAQLQRCFSKPRTTAQERQALADWAWENFDWKNLGPRYAALYASLR